jgi:hypothetical protein
MLKLLNTLALSFVFYKFGLQQETMPDAVAISFNKTSININTYYYFNQHSICICAANFDD